MKVGGRTLAAALVAAGLLAPASANAAVTATLTGDDGQPAPLTAGVPAGIRNMDASVSVALAQGDATSWRFVVSDATGTPVTDATCWSSVTPKTSSVPYRGNGAYLLTVTTYAAASCAGTPKASVAYGWTVAASVALGGAPGPLPTRAANSLTTNVHLLDFAGNPGTSLYEIRYAKGGVIGPDGGISGPSSATYVDSATGKVRLPAFDGPGQYVVVARAQKGSYFTPWSAPVAVTMVAPFDISSIFWPDSRGPSYQVQGTVREKILAGSRVTVAVAKGKKGKKFRTLGKAKVSSTGVFKLRVRLSRGTWRLRYSFSGNALVTKGTVYKVETITRRVF